MLALKTILAQADNTGVLIFDEIDTGISGRTAQTVAQKLYSLSTSRQILCITHLPQLAAMADSHYVIEKSVKDENTFTSLAFIEEEARTTEMARMLGGVEVTDLTLRNAREMLSLARDYKSQVSLIHP